MGIQDVEPGAGQIQDVPTSPNNRFIKISVPHFKGDTNPMGSYLRIGATEPDVTPGIHNGLPGAFDPTGEDLAAYVTSADGTTSFGDDGRDRGLANPTPPSGQAPAAAPESLPPGTPATTLAEESTRAVLHGKGGWRDHTDGNRVTTTRGDKVEVIRGNYKMVILGRQNLALSPDDPYFFDEWATGLDESGGLSDNQDQAHGVNGVLDISYTWQKDSDGRWGWTQVTRTGAFNTSVTPTSQGNGKQVSFTWVDEIWSYTGSPEPDTTTMKPVVLPVDETKPTKPVKMMVTKAWAETIVQETNAVTIDGGAASWSDDGSIVVQGPIVASDPPRTASFSATTISEGDMSNTSRSFGKTTNVSEAAGGFSNSITSGGEIQNHTTCSSDIYETTSCRSIHMNFDMAPLILNMAFAAIVTEIKSLIHLDLHVGMHMDMHIGEHLDIHTGVHTQIENFHMEAGLDYDAVRALKNEITAGTIHLTANEARLAGMISLG